MERQKKAAVREQMNEFVGLYDGKHDIHLLENVYKK